MHATSINKDTPFKKLGDVCKIINGFFFPKSAQQPNVTQVPYAKATDIVANHLTTTNTSVPNVLAKKMKAEIATKGALLIALTGAAIGQIAMLDIDAFIDPNLCAVVNEWLEVLDNQFLYYFLSVNVPFLVHHTKTSDRIQSLQLKDLTIPMPSLNEQRLLVKKIKQKITVIDAAIESLQQQIATAKVKRQNTIDDAFTKNSHNIATQTINVNLASIANIQAGNTPTEFMAVYYGNDYVFFKPNDIYQADNMVTSNTQVSARGAKVARLILPNALLVVTSGFLLGKVGITKIKATCNRSLTAIMPYKNVSTEFLYFQFQSKAIQTQIMAVEVKSIITKSKLATLQCIIVPLPLQTAIVDYLKEKLPIIDTIVTNSQIGIDALTQKKEQLLFATFKSE